MICCNHIQKLPTQSKTVLKSECKIMEPFELPKLTVFYHQLKALYVGRNISEVGNTVSFREMKIRLGSLNQALNNIFLIWRQKTF